MRVNDSPVKPDKSSHHYTKRGLNVHGQRALKTTNTLGKPNLVFRMGR